MGRHGILFYGAFIMLCWFLYIGIPLTLLFMFPFKQIGKLGQEIIPFILGVIGAGTDIISYIRLFAVGLATVAVADAANSMPEALGAGGYLTPTTTATESYNGTSWTTVNAMGTAR